VLEVNIHVEYGMDSRIKCKNDRTKWFRMTRNKTPENDCQSHVPVHDIIEAAKKYKEEHGDERPQNTLIPIRKRGKQNR